MRIVTQPDVPMVRRLRYSSENGRARITFEWPEGIEQVLIFKACDGDSEFFCDEHEKPPRLFTLQEYKRLSGYNEAVTPGTYTYKIYPFVRENGEDICYVPEQSSEQPNESQITITETVKIMYSINENKAAIEIKIQTSHLLPETVICYVKNTHHPQNVTDGTRYFFPAPLTPNHPHIWEVEIKPGEYIDIFLTEENPLYKLTRT